MVNVTYRTGTIKELINPTTIETFDKIEKAAEQFQATTPSLIIIPNGIGIYQLFEDIDLIEDIDLFTDKEKEEKQKNLLIGKQLGYSPNLVGILYNSNIEENVVRELGKGVLGRVALSPFSGDTDLIPNYDNKKIPPIPKIGDDVFNTTDKDKIKKVLKPIIDQYKSIRRDYGLTAKEEYFFQSMRDFVSEAKRIHSPNLIEIITYGSTDY